MSFPVAVLASGEGTNLQAILDGVHGREGVEVVCVGSNNPAAPALDRATSAGIETGVFPIAEFAGRRERDAALGDWLEAHDARLVVLAGFMELLGGEFIRRFSGRVINVHPSLLPAFPGMRAIEQALQHGVKVTGVTIHFVDEGVDSGPIILQRSLELPYPRDIEAVEQRLHEIEHDLLPHAVLLLARGAVRLDPQNPRRAIVDEEADVRR